VVCALEIMGIRVKNREKTKVRILRISYL